MSLPENDGFSAAVTSGHNYARSLYVCDIYGDVIEELPVADATTIEIGDGLIWRSGNIVIPNASGLYTPSSGGLIDFGRAFLFRYTVQTPDGDLSCDQPLLFPDSDEFEVGGDVTIPVSDGMRIVGSDAKLSRPLSFTDGTPLEDVIRGLLVAAGAPDDDAYFDLVSEGESVAGLHGYEVGTGIADTLSSLLTDHDCDLWAAPPLVYTLRPTPDPLVDDPIATWTVGDDVKLVGLNVKRSQNAKNHAIVEGVDRQGHPFTVEVFDRNPRSPVMFGAPGVGDLLVTRKSDSIRDDDQAARVGASLLARYSTIRTFTAIVPANPALNRHDVVRIIDNERGTDTTVLLDTFSLPSAPGTQSFQVREGRELE